MLIGALIEQKPKNQPHKAQGARNYKRSSPSPVHGDPRHDPWGKNCANIGSRIEDSGCQRPLLPWEPLCYGLDARGKNPSFSKTEGRPCQDEAKKGNADGMGHGSQAPKHHRESVTKTGAEAIHQSPHGQHSNGIRRLKNKNQVTVVDLIPAQVVLECALQHPQDLAVHVVLSYSEQKKTADYPAEMTHAAG